MVSFMMEVAIQDYPLDMVAEPQEPDDNRPDHQQYHDAGYLSVYDSYRAPDPYLYTAISLLWAPYHVLSNYREIILISLVARLITSLIEIPTFPSKRIIKQLALIILGAYQLDRYLKKSCPDLLNSRDMLFAIALCYASYGALALKLRTRILRAKIPNQRAMCSASLYFIAFAPIIYNEHRIQLGTNPQFCYLRSIFMTFTMKLFNMISAESHPKDPFSLMAYLLHPASSVLGAWHPYNDGEVNGGKAVQARKTAWYKPILKLVMSSLELLALLIISTNTTDLIEHIGLLPLPELVKTPIRIYLTSLEFRYSHYFSCYLAAALISTFMDLNGQSYQICDIKRVEWPRSLVDVVIAWNKPVHFWLKRYVFKRMLKNYTTASAIFVTYVVSSLLHGCKFHICSVLLTLGCLTWVEHKVRRKLAKKFSACVLAQECQYKRKLKNGQLICTRGHSLNWENSGLVILINLLFRFCAIAQLAYLGYIFVGDTDQATYKEAIDRWADLYFFGHVLGLATYLISFVI